MAASQSMDQHNDQITGPQAAPQRPPRPEGSVRAASLSRDGRLGDRLRALSGHRVGPAARLLEVTPRLGLGVQRVAPGVGIGTSAALRAPSVAADSAPQPSGEPAAGLQTPIPAGAKHPATQMAASGSSRAEIEARLRDESGIDDVDSMLDAILSEEA